MLTAIVNPANDRPEAMNESAVLAKDRTNGVDLLANDSDPEGEPLRYFRRIPTKASVYLRRFETDFRTRSTTLRPDVQGSI